jgi:hypothetical protein
LIVEAIKSSGGDCSQQALALQLALAHPEIRQIAKAAVWEKEGDKALSFHWNQIRDLVQVAASKEQQKGHVNQDCALFLESILTAVAPDSVDENTPSLRSRSSLLGLPLSTMRRKLRVGTKKRNALKARNGTMFWSKAERARKGHSKVTLAVQAAVCKWIINHENVVHSPISSDTLLVKLFGFNTKQPIGKLLLEIPVRDLHNHLVSRVEEGGLPQARNQNGDIVISDTALRRIIKSDIPQLRRLTERYKQMCGCELCITVATHQRSLNAWRFRKLRELGNKINSTQGENDRLLAVARHAGYRDFMLPAGVPLHSKSRDAVKAIMCQPLECGYPPWNCVLQRCENCPKFPTCAIKEQEEGGDAIICFTQYQKGDKVFETWGPQTQRKDLQRVFTP